VTFRNFENIYVELADEQAVRGFVPDFLKIAELDPLGPVITARGDSHDFVSRCFSPAPEFPKTRSLVPPMPRSSHTGRRSSEKRDFPRFNALGEEDVWTASMPLTRC
jgi:hypothetical protein